MWYGVVALALLCAGVLAVPLELTTQSIVITSEAPSTEPKTTSTAVSTKPQLKSFKVTSNIGFRYAVTEVSSKVLNPAGQPQTAGFSVVLPETAFVSGFLMEIEGKVYKAHVKEKEEAKKVYDAAVSAGQFAAHVSVSARDSNKFEVDVSIPAQQKAVFNLTYEELLTRKVGVYNHVLNLNPGQIVKDMTVDVYITENRPINTLRVPELRTGNEIDADESDPNSSIASIEHAENDKKAHIHFAPTPLEQQRLIDDLKNKEKKENAGSRRRHNPFHPDSSNDNPHDEGVKGQFVVQYDVERDPEAGEILVYDGYFVHFFSPSDLKPLPKHVVFVLDRSGSMYNEKIRQLREAMTYILSDLKPEDYFNIVEFSYSAKAWNIDNYEDSPVFVSKSSDNYWGYQETGKTGPPPEPYPATPENINKAKQLVQNLTADGGTNIYDALDTGMKIANKGLLKSAGVNVTRPEPMIIFLTDGDPTVGETSLEKIYAVVEENKLGPKSPSIFSLAFGEDADRNFLRKLSLRNHGFLRHIYEAADASKQLQHFYREVSSPLLSNVKFTYPENQIEEATITRHAFPILFKGTELVVTGKLVPEVQAIESSIEASGSHGLWRCDYPIRPIIPTPPPPPKAERKTAPLERLWAYLTIKQLLDQNDADLPKPSTPDVVDGPTESSSSTEAALVDPVQTGKKKETPKEKALKLALEYSFVTPLTSLVVVKPNETERAVNAESAKPGSGHGGYGVALPLSLNAVSNRGPVGTSYYSAPGLPGPPAYPIAASYPTPGRPAATYQTTELHDTVDSVFVSTSAAPVITTSTQGLLPELRGYEWLQSYVTDGKLVLEIAGVQKTYNLTAEYVSEEPQCPSTIRATPGTCVPFSQCVSAGSLTDTIDKLRNHICEVKGYAGVCCDPQDKDSELTFNP